MYRLYEKTSDGNYSIIGKNLSMLDLMVLAQITKNQRKGKVKLYYKAYNKEKFYKLY